MTLKDRLSKLEKTKRGIIAEADCICVPPDEPPLPELRAEAEAAKSVLCPLHGERFSRVAPYFFRVIDLPIHLEPFLENQAVAALYQDDGCQFPVPALADNKDR